MNHFACTKERYASTFGIFDDPIFHTLITYIEYTENNILACVATPRTYLRIHNPRTFASIVMRPLAPRVVFSWATSGALDESYVISLLPEQSITPAKGQDIPSAAYSSVFDQNLLKGSVAPLWAHSRIDITSPPRRNISLRRYE